MRQEKNMYLMRLREMAPLERTIQTLRRKVFKETQEEFAGRFGVHPMQVSKWERGISNPQGSSFSRIYGYFQVNRSVVFEQLKK